MESVSEFEQELRTVIQPRQSRKRQRYTHDFILAAYLNDCLCRHSIVP